MPSLPLPAWLPGAKDKSKIIVLSDVSDFGMEWPNGYGLWSNGPNVAPNHHSLLMYSSMALGNSLAPLWLLGGTACWITPWKLIGKPDSRKSKGFSSWKPLAKSRTATTFMAVLTGTLHLLKFGKPDNFTRACNWMLRCSSGQYFIGILGLGWNSAAWGFRLREFTLTGSTTAVWHPLTSHLLPSSPTSPPAWPPVELWATTDPSATSTSSSS